MDDYRPAEEISQSDYEYAEDNPELEVLTPAQLYTGVVLT